MLSKFNLLYLYMFPLFCRSYPHPDLPVLIVFTSRWLLEPKCCQMLIFCQLGSLQPHMQLPSPSPWTEVWIFSWLKTGSNLGQCSGKRNSYSWTFDTNRNPWQFSGAWHWLGAQRVSHQLVQEYLHSFWLGTCRAKHIESTSNMKQESEIYKSPTIDRI